MILRVTTLLLLALGCGLWAHAAAPGTGPVLTISAPAQVMIQDSTNLVEWQDVIVTPELTVLGNDPQRNFRGRVVRVDVTLHWDSTNTVNIYFGAATHDYRNCIQGCTGGVATITVIEPSPALYFAATKPTATEESDFSNEIVYTVPKPTLQILKN